MKKTIKTLALAALATFAMSSCDEIDPTIINDMFGHANLTIIEADGSVDTVNFESGISDVIFKSFLPGDTLYIDDSIVVVDEGVTIHSAATLAANMDFSSENVLTYPYMAVMTNDSIAGTYAVTAILTNENLRDFQFNTFVKDPTDCNIVAIALSDTSWYVSNSGNITISAYPTYGYMTTGSFDGVQAYYFTLSQLDAIKAILSENPEAEIDLNTYMSPVSLSGSFECRRAAVNALLESLTVE